MRAQAGNLAAEDIQGVFWLAGRLGGTKPEQPDWIPPASPEGIPRRPDNFEAPWEFSRIELENGRGQPLARFGAVTGELVREQALRLRDDLTRVRGASDVEEVHRVRIAVKRLRYLLEPVARGNRRAGALIRQLKEAQDLLGEHHDMHVLSSEVASLRGDLSSSAFPGVEPGLANVARLAEVAATAAFERFHSMWGGEPAGRILTRAEELGRSLMQPPSPAGEIPNRQEVSVSEPARVEADPPMALETR